MTRKLKPIETIVEEGISQDILSLPVVDENGVLSTVGQNIQKAAALLTDTNKVLAENALVNIVAKTLMQQMNRRGHAGIRVRPDGTVVLRVAYHAEDVGPEAFRSPLTKSKLPSLAQLRKEAAEKEIDISDLGRQKTLILKRLEEAPPIEESLVVPPSRLRDEIGEADDPTGKTRLPPRR